MIAILMRLYLTIALVAVIGCDVGSVILENPPAKQAASQTESADEVVEQTSDDDVPIGSPTKDRPVVFATAVFPQQSRPGSAVTLAVRIRMGIGWHIQAVDNGHSAGPSSPTTLKLLRPSGIDFASDWLLPEPDTDFEQPGQSLIYQGDVTFRRKLKIPANQPPGAVEFPCVISYQACDATICHRATTIELKPMLEILPR